jgi:hypothetical protein
MIRTMPPRSGQVRVGVVDTRCTSFRSTRHFAIGRDSADLTPASWSAPRAKHHRRDHSVAHGAGPAGSIGSRWLVRRRRALVRSSRGPHAAEEGFDGVREQPRTSTAEPTTPALRQSTLASVLERRSRPFVATTWMASLDAT